MMLRLIERHKRQQNSGIVFLILMYKPGQKVSIFY